jgi:hypothetical protein
MKRRAFLVRTAMAGAAAVVVGRRFTAAAPAQAVPNPIPNLLRNGSFQDDWLSLLPQNQTLHWAYANTIYNRRDLHQDGWTCTGNWQWLDADQPRGRRRVVIGGPNCLIAQRLTGGELTEDRASGAAIIRWKWDGKKQMVEQSHFGTDQKAKPDARRGVAIVRWQHDASGNTTEESYFGADGRPTTDRPRGVASVRGSMVRRARPWKRATSAPTVGRCQTRIAASPWCAGSTTIPRTPSRSVTSGRICSRRPTAATGGHHPLGVRSLRPRDWHIDVRSQRAARSEYPQLASPGVRRPLSVIRGPRWPARGGAAAWRARGFWRS